MSQYVITDGSRFIYRNHQNKYVPAPGEAMADIYTLKQAESIFKNSLSRPLRKVFRIEKRDESSTNLKQVPQIGLKKETEKLGNSDNIQMWIDKISNMNGLVKEVEGRREFLLKQLSNIDQEISDCLHYIEFYKLNAAQGYTAYKLIKERRIKRRSIKNELYILEIILNKGFEEPLVEEINTAIYKMDKRTYEPRVLTELFNSQTFI